VTLTAHPLLASRSRECRAIPLPPLWAFEYVTGYLYLYLYICEYVLKYIIDSDSTQEHAIPYKGKLVKLEKILKAWNIDKSNHDIHSNK
jgi:hypothetical protein